MGPSVHEKVQDLHRVLGTSLLAFTLASEMRHVGYWVDGSPVPSGQAKRVECAYETVQILREVEADETIRAWFVGMKDVLYGLSPAEVIKSGDYRSVLDVARAYVQAA